MFTNKPEFIDPEDKNLTYYYNRNKSKKRLAEIPTAPRKRLLVFNTAKGKTLFILFYLLLVGYLFLADAQKARQQTSYDKKLGPIKYTLSAFFSQAKLELSVQILIKNEKEEPQNLDIQDFHLKAYNAKQEELFTMSRQNFTIHLKSQGLIVLKEKRSHPTKPARVQIMIQLSQKPPLMLERDVP